MKTDAKTLLYYLGLFLIAACAIMFAFQIQNPSDDILDESTFFWINYVISAVYFVVMLVRHLKEHGWKIWRNWRKLDEKIYSVSLVLFSISAHTLNYGTEIQVFADYATWMNIYVVLMHVSVLAFPFRHKLPEILQYVLYFLSGAGLILSLYLCIFIAPLVAIGFVLSFFFGFSLHVTVPFWFTLYYIFAGIRKRPLIYARTAYWSGILLPVIILAIYTWRWQGVQNGIEELREEYQLTYSHAYPEWVFLNQHLSDDPLTERVITSRAFAQKAFWDNPDWMPQINTRGFDLRHDPLAVSARLFYGEIDIDNETLLNFLNAKYDARHQTHRRLWSSDDLETQSVETAVKIYAPYRIAYIEKTIEVYNSAKPGRWRANEQEAVYTFFMPEGAVASSLSLWIEGEERFSRLTTRSKADSAYVSIVGVEVRDPALMHWQEGNRLTLTVFPCPAQEFRRFKIGITTPLKLENDHLLLENIYFDGPPPQGAASKVDVSFVEHFPNSLKLPQDFVKHAQSNRYNYAGTYQPDWQVSFDPFEIPSSSFSFQGNTYQISSTSEEEVYFDAKEIILDINREWKKGVFEDLLEMLKDRSVYTFTPEKTLITAENKDEIFEQLSEQGFSLLPLNEIGNLSQTLVISYEPERSPLLQDLEGSFYADNLSDWLRNIEGNLHWYRLNDKVSPFLRSLRELDIVNDAHGDLNQLEDWLKRDVFVKIQTDIDRVSLKAADIQIIRTADSSKSEMDNQAPDHLLRLFAYQDLMRQIGRDYFDKGALEEVWLRQAEEAYIVSPISSLVVLETQADYENFGIEENRDSLGNASDDHAGSVPEPHEWVLILIVMGLVVWIFYSRQLVSR